MIPTKSAMIFGKELYEVVTLTDPIGQAWQVGLKRDGEGIWLHDGLQEFLDYYSVHYFYNLHFRYDGDSAFGVCICDAFGSEIDYPCDGPSRDVKHEEEGTIGDYSVEIWDLEPPIPDHGLFVTHKTVTGDDEGVEILDVKPSIYHGSLPFRGEVEQRSPRKRRTFHSQQKVCWPTKRCRNAASVDSLPKTLNIEEQVDLRELVNGDTSERGKAEENKVHRPPTLLAEHGEDAEMYVPKSLFYAKSRLVISKETEEAVRAASMCKLENPSFLVILRAHNEKHVDLPAGFIKRHMSRCSEDIQLQVHNGRRKWPVRCYYRGIRDKNGSRTMKKMGKGWRQFSADNNLQVGDVCVFELTKKGNDIVLRVWIYRAADYVTPI